MEQSQNQATPTKDNPKQNPNEKKEDLPPEKLNNVPQTSTTENTKPQINASTNSLESNSAIQLFPNRPNFNNTGTKIKLVSNYFPINSLGFVSKTNNVYKYDIKFEPQVPDDSIGIRKHLVSNISEELKKKLSIFFFLNTMIYSPELIAEPIELTSKLKNDDKEYKITVKYARDIPVEQSLKELFPIFKKFFYLSLDKKKFVPFKNSFLIQGSGKEVTTDLQIVNGFTPTISNYNNKILVNISMNNKIIRLKRVYDLLKEISSQANNKSDFMQQAKMEICRTSVLTRYNRDKLYQVDGIDFSQCPTSTFLCKGETVSFLDYYQKRYNIKISDLQQPLLLTTDKKTKQKCFLIPELCFLTGLTDEMRRNFNLMKSISKYTIGQAHQKTMECIDMVKEIVKSANYQVQSVKTGFTLSNEPVEFEGRKLNPGCFLVGNKEKVRIDNNHEIDRQIQTKMYDSPIFDCWAIFYPRSSFKSIPVIMSTLCQVFNTFQIKANKPFQIQVDGMNSSQWIDKIRQEALQNKIKFCLVILQGKSKKGRGYKEIKSFCNSELGIPTQMIVEGTIERKNGLRSVLNKLVIQMCAKNNGVPWAIDEMPCSSKPTAIISFSPSKNILSSVCTCNSSFSQYFAKANMIPPNETLLGQILKHIDEHMKRFYGKYKRAPSQLIIFRENESKNGNMKIFSAEVQEIHKFIRQKSKSLEFAYILCNKKHNLKIVTQDEHSNYANIPSGTLIDSTIVGNEFDYYLVSQKTNQGISQSTYYKVIYNGLNLKAEDIHLLTYKSCFLYYNWVGGIKIPAPQHYAKKLSSMMTDVMTNPGNNVLSLHQDLQSLFFI